MLYFFRAVSANGNTSGLQPEIKSSILLRSTKFSVCNVSQVRRLGLELRGRRFESFYTDHFLALLVQW
jgi:hypothetical protein